MGATEKALSREDNETVICSGCATNEALPGFQSPSVELAWFVVFWGIEGARMDGPFGDDREAAKRYLLREVHEGREEAGALTQLLLQSTYVGTGLPVKEVEG